MILNMTMLLKMRNKVVTVKFEDDSSIKGILDDFDNYGIILIYTNFDRQTIKHYIKHDSYNEMFCIMEVEE